jgi:hypothetical protein
MHTDPWNPDSPQNNSPSVEELLHALSIDLNPVHHADHSQNSGHVEDLLRDLHRVSGTDQHNDHANGLHQWLQNLNPAIDPLHDTHLPKHQPHAELSEANHPPHHAQLTSPVYGNSNFASASTPLGLPDATHSFSMSASPTSNLGDSLSIELQQKGGFELNTGLGFQDISAHSAVAPNESTGSVHSEPVTLHSPSHAQVMQSCGGAITPDSRRSVDINSGGWIYWHDRPYIIGQVDGHKFYDSSQGYEGHLSTSLKVYDKHDNYIGYVTPNGCAYTPDGQLFARGGTPLWAAATLLYNLR